MSLTTFDWIIILLSLLVCFVPALFFGRRAGRSTSEFFASGRAVPWWLAGLSMVATTFSSDTPNLVTDIVWTFVSFWDIVAGLLGVRPEKILRVCPVILSDEKGNPVASVENMVAVLQLACKIYKRDANIRIVPSRPFHYATGFAGPETVTADWVIVSPTPLDGVAIARTPAKIAPDQLDGWRRQWGGPSERVDLVDGVGQVYTPAEKTGATGALTQDDPAPQTIFRVTGKAGDPALVSFRLKYR